MACHYTTNEYQAISETNRSRYREGKLGARITMEKSAVNEMSSEHWIRKCHDGSILLKGSARDLENRQTAQAPLHTQEYLNEPFKCQGNPTTDALANYSHTITLYHTNQHESSFQTLTKGNTRYTKFNGSRKKPFERPMTYMLPITSTP